MVDAARACVVIGLESWAIVFGAARTGEAGALATFRLLVGVLGAGAAAAAATGGFDGGS